MIDEFLRSIREDRKPLITGEDGLRALEVVIAAYESGKSHQPITLKKA